MQKLTDNNWNGAIFAAAGLERIEIKPENFIDLNWMIPAPAQGAMLIVAMENDSYCREALAMLNHRESEICVHIEREFLKVLEGGCTAPIGALAKVLDDHVHFHGALFSLDGKKKIEVERTLPLSEVDLMGKECALEILNNGGKELMKNIKTVLNN